MADFPAMPLWTDAYLADTGHLSDVEHGRYMLMLMQLWRSPQQRFPNDDEWLARRFKRSVEEVKKELRPLIQELMQCDGNWITQKRLSREFCYVSARSQKQSARAKSRWKKEKGLCRGNAERHRSGNAPTPTPTPIEKEDTNVSSKKNGSRLNVFMKANGEIPKPPSEYLSAADELGIDGGSQWPRFWDYWIAQPGSKGVKLDWLATWRNWCRRCSESNGGSRPPPPELSSEDSIEVERNILRMRINASLKGMTVQHELQPHEWQNAVNLGYVTMHEAQQRCPALININR